MYTLLLELLVVAEDVQRKRVIPIQQVQPPRLTQETKHQEKVGDLHAVDDPQSLI